MIDTAKLRALLASMVPPLPWTKAVDLPAYDDEMDSSWKLLDARGRAVCDDLDEMVADAILAFVGPALLDELDALRADLDVERLKPLLDYEKQAEAWRTRALMVEAERDRLREEAEAMRAYNEDIGRGQDRAEEDSRKLHLEVVAWRTATGCDSPAEARSEREDAAGECLVAMPEPGSDAARMLTANVLMRRELARLRELERTCTCKR